MFDPKDMAPLFAQRRWFGHDRIIHDLRIVDAMPLHDTAASTAQGPAIWLVLTEVTVDDAQGNRTRELFHLPVVQDAGAGGLRDATEDSDSLQALGRYLQAAHELRGEHGTVKFHGHHTPPADGGNLTPPVVRRMPGEQSNTSLVFDEKTIVKLMRRVTRGPNPDIEMTRILVERNFGGTPAYVGSFTYVPDGATPGESIDLGVATAYEKGAHDAWSWLLRITSAHFLTGSDAHHGDLQRLGALTAELHLTLGGTSEDPSFKPERLRSADLNRMAERVRAELGALEATPHMAPFPAIAQWLQESTPIRDDHDLGAAIRIHGDFHLGQVLVVGDRFLILDFEGEPSRTLSERRAKQSPLKDVAGMLRSFGYVAGATMLTLAPPDSDAYRDLVPRVAAWETAARDHFLRGYLDTASTLLPRDTSRRESVLHVFEIDKALYEVEYERRFRPDWLDVPLLGLRRIESLLAQTKP